MYVIQKRNEKNSYYQMLTLKKNNTIGKFDNFHETHFAEVCLVPKKFYDK